MIRLDFNVACNMACAGLPEGLAIEIHLEKGVSLLGLVPSNGAPQDFSTAGPTTADQMLKTIAVAKASQLSAREGQSKCSKARPRKRRNQSGAL
jgi:hypothetical protein